MMAHFPCLYTPIRSLWLLEYRIGSLNLFREDILDTSQILPMSPLHNQPSDVVCGCVALSDSATEMACKKYA